jgi:hypothetical protein
VQHPSYASTPQRAALGALYPVRPTVVVRTNVAGRYAAVLVRGAWLEGAPINAPILVERFSFGWQPLELLNFRCRLHSHGLPRHDEQRLMRGMPTMLDDRACREDSRDAGPVRQVESVRRLMQGPLTPWVTVAGGYALGDWYGAGGGYGLFRLRADSWQRIAGGGALGVSDMRRYHIPQSAWCTFRIYDAPCNVR